MRSKVAQDILAETPEETRIFVRQYADIVVRINELLLQKGYNQKEAVLGAPIISVPHGSAH